MERKSWRGRGAPEQPWQYLDEVQRRTYWSKSGSDDNTNEIFGACPKEDLDADSRRQGLSKKNHLDWTFLLNCSRIANRLHGVNLQNYSKLPH